MKKHVPGTKLENGHSLALKAGNAKIRTLCETITALENKWLDKDFIANIRSGELYKLSTYNLLRVHIMFETTLKISF